ncbi:MAG TPA: 3-phosphoshikimate 1-carboxyvinyltransferase [Fimbriimonas sp.]|nr:3-phosphoshikimate 1-carboxyvinyltransferase [Fimbriimonas sp.]
MILKINPVATLQGELRPPSDKSLTHRAYMFAGLANGDCYVRMPLTGEDCEATLRCMGQLGLGHEWIGVNEVRLVPMSEWRQPGSYLDCGNSGTTIRLLSGLLASRPLDCTLVGDASLSRRPMNRIAAPLREMGANVEGDTPPLHIVGSQLQGIRYQSPVPSAQVKSCILLAGLGAEGVTRVTEPTLSRDHTERMLTAMGVELDYPVPAMGEDAYSVELHGGQTGLRPFRLTVPSDISSAAFFLVAAAALPQGQLLVRDLLMNPSRTGLLDVLRQCGVPMDSGEDRSELGEPVADLEIRAPDSLRPFKIDAEVVPRLIDEIPALAVLATQCHGVTEIRGAAELRVKESDRLEVMAEGLRAMGADIETYPDGLSISGPTCLNGTSIHARGDHRIAMSFAIAGLFAEGETIIEGAEAIDTSYPNFEVDLMRLSIV